MAEMKESMEMKAAKLSAIFLANFYSLYENSITRDLPAMREFSRFVFAISDSKKSYDDLDEIWDDFLEALNPQDEEQQSGAKIILSTLPEGSVRLTRFQDLLKQLQVQNAGLEMAGAIRAAIANRSDLDASSPTQQLKAQYERVIKQLQQIKESTEMSAVLRDVCLTPEDVPLAMEHMWRRIGGLEGMMKTEEELRKQHAAKVLKRWNAESKLPLSDYSGKSFDNTEESLEHLFLCMQAQMHEQMAQQIGGEQKFDSRDYLAQLQSAMLKAIRDNRVTLGDAMIALRNSMFPPGEQKMFAMLASEEEERVKEWHRLVSLSSAERAELQKQQEEENQRQLLELQALTEQERKKKIEDDQQSRKRYQNMQMEHARDLASYLGKKTHVDGMVHYVTATACKQMKFTPDEITAAYAAAEIGVSAEERRALARIAIAASERFQKEQAEEKEKVAAAERERKRKIEEEKSIEQKTKEHRDRVDQGAKAYRLKLDGAASASIYEVVAQQLCTADGLFNKTRMLSKVSWLKDNPNLSVAEVAKMLQAATQFYLKDMGEAKVLTSEQQRLILATALSRALGLHVSIIFDSQQIGAPGAGLYSPQECLVRRPKMPTSLDSTLVIADLGSAGYSRFKLISDEKMKKERINPILNNSRKLSGRLSGMKEDVEVTQYSIVSDESKKGCKM